MSRNTCLILIFLFSILGPCVVLATSSYASIMALGRNPFAAPKIFTAMIIAVISAQAIAFVAMLIVFQLFSA